jgi:phosphatidylserine decarboxylase
VRVPLTKFGLPQAAIIPAALLTVLAGCLLLGPQFLSPWLLIAIEVTLLVLLALAVAFFRDPERGVTQDKNLLLAPADGKITNIETVNEKSFIAAPALRIGIFLNIFDVHINRSPCSATVQAVQYRKGRFTNAANPTAGKVNESNDLFLSRLDEPRDRLIVRQIAGAVARRIVCAAMPGRDLAAGEKFGMIKFGSRTELYLPARENVKCLVKIGDKVKAGLTPLVRYEKSPGHGPDAIIKID